jgi:hypothetical protein
MAIIIFSAWHYGKVYHENQRGNIDFQEALGKVILILLMSYLLYANTLLFFAITFGKFLYDIFLIFISPSPALLHLKNKENLFDAMIGLTCCVVYIIG